MTAPYATEAELCAQFMEWARIKGWTPYPETAGWDVLVVAPDGRQIGVEAKLTLNAKVLTQALQCRFSALYDAQGPDFRAVLVPAYRSAGFDTICDALGISIIRGSGPGPVSQRGARNGQPAFSPDLPKGAGQRRDPFEEQDWFDLCPEQRCALPDFVPDTAAGTPSPVVLTDWKIKAIKLILVLRRRGYVTRADFRHLALDPRRWISNGWLRHRGNGEGYVLGAAPDFAGQHPRNVAEIDATFDAWAPKPSTDLLGGSAT